LRLSRNDKLHVLIIEDHGLVPSSIPFKSAYNKLQIHKVFENFDFQAALFLDLDVFIDESLFRDRFPDVFCSRGFRWLDLTAEMQIAIQAHDFLYHGLTSDKHFWVGGEAFVLTRDAAQEFEHLINVILREHAEWHSENKLKVYGDEVLLTRMIALRPTFHVEKFEPTVIKRYWTIPVLHRRRFSDVFPVGYTIFYHLPNEKMVFSFFNRFNLRSVFWVRLYILFRVLMPRNILKALI
jgi:hypothetical protein